MRQSPSEEDENRYNTLATPKRRNLEDVPRPTKKGTPVSESLTEYYIKNIEFTSSPPRHAPNFQDSYYKEEVQPPQPHTKLVTHSTDETGQQAYRMSLQRYGKIPPLIDVPTNYYGTAPTGNAKPSESGHKN